MSMFSVLDDKDTIQPTYHCGKPGPKVRISDNGTNHAIWTLMTDFETHLDGVKGKGGCRTCQDVQYPDEKAFRDFLAYVKEDVRMATESFKLTGDIFKAATEKVKALQEVLV